MAVTQTQAQKAGAGLIAREADDVLFSTLGGLYVGVGAGDPAGIGGTDTIPDGSLWIDATGDKLYMHNGSGVWEVIGGSEKKVLTVQYDFDTDAGAVGDIDFGEYLPAGAIVTDVWSEELTNATSDGSATMALAAGSTVLVAAIAIATFSGIIKETLNGSADGIKVAARTEVKATIAVADFTAGKINFHIEYIDTAGE